MKAYFTASIVARNDYLRDYQQTISELERLGYSVQADHILHSNPEDIRSANRDTRLNFHKKVEEWIRTCDIMVANVSFPSISVGYEIAMALNQNKPVLALYRTSTKPPNLLIDFKNDWVVCEAYSQQTLPSLIEEFHEFSKSRVEMRFTFFITPAIATHLEKAAKRENMPKSVYLRRLIEHDMAPK